MDYRGWAILSAIFAGATAVLAKIGVQGVPSNLALAVRVLVVVAFAWAVALATGEAQTAALDSRAWLFLTLSGFATGLSWLCYFRALSLGPVSKVAPIDKLSFVFAMLLGFVALGEKPTAKLLAGAGIIVVGVLITIS